MTDRHDIDLLQRWLAAEAAAERAAAEGDGGRTPAGAGPPDGAPVRTGVEAERADEALAALFTALPEPAPSPSLAARLSTVADRAAAERVARRPVLLGLPRRAVERLAAGLLLFLGLAAALVQTVFRDAASPTLVRVSPGRVLASAAEALITIFYGLRDWAEAAAEIVDGVLRLSGAAATVAGTTPVAIALGGGVVLAVLAFKLLRDLISKERGFSHADPD